MVYILLLRPVIAVFVVLFLLAFARRFRTWTFITLASSGLVTLAFARMLAETVINLATAAPKGNAWVLYHTYLSGQMGFMMALLASPIIPVFNLIAKFLIGGVFFLCMSVAILVVLPLAHFDTSIFSVTAALVVFIVLSMLWSTRSLRLAFVQTDQQIKHFQRLKRGNERYLKLLEGTLPATVLDSLRTNPTATSQKVPAATVFFADFVKFTEFCVAVPSVFVVQLLDEIYARFDLISKSHGVTPIATIGDCYFAGSGIAAPNPNHTRDCVLAALEILRTVKLFNGEKGISLALRVGLHTGTVFSGVLGVTRFTFDVWGPAVTEAKKLESASSPSRLLISQATKARVPRGTAHFREGPVISSCPTFFVSRSRTAR
eukprot:gnl/Trimastix_PCT/527.p1 GENE.gnl/Trimastix_PCT/527~~gnl/Trimastix_PCT/527.p1  ORF type:complete len:375 (-),score=124.38 gnl/Trimastix_PCT/527:638-1762(-)